MFCSVLNPRGPSYLVAEARSGHDTTLFREISTLDLLVCTILGLLYVPISCPLTYGSCRSDVTTTVALAPRPDLELTPPKTFRAFR